MKGKLVQYVVLFTKKMNLIHSGSVVITVVFGTVLSVLMCQKIIFLMYTTVIDARI